MAISLFNISKKKTSTNESIIHEAYFNQLREREYKRLTETGHTYLDYTGGNLYSSVQVNLHHKMLMDQVFGNPHSTNPTSSLSTQRVEETRQKVLDFFNAADYYCIFTPNASGALKIVGESYPFDTDSIFVLTSDNHNSVNGIREYCKRNGGAFAYAKLQYEDLNLDTAHLESLLNSASEKKRKLFAFPAQSNVSGVKHDLNWIEKAHQKGWDVLLDAAAFVPTSRLDLGKVKPDFVSVSFYKIFGYPTGIGCLLVKKDKFDVLQKKWFAGGTVTLAAVMSPDHYLANNHERFEDGTINYLDIPAIKTGLEFIENIGMDRINERVNALMHYLYTALKHIKHDTGVSVVKLLGPEEHKNAGGTLIMTFFNPDGSLAPFELIEQKANKLNISVRAGCFCNPGIDEVNNCLTSSELHAYFSSREKGNYQDMIHYLNKMRGAIRVSVGIPTIQKDLDTFIRFVSALKNQTIRF